MIRPFWRDEPLSEPEHKLLEAVFKAHAMSAMRENCSTVALRNAASGSGRIETALIAALASVGGSHAPITEIFKFLENDRATNDLGGYLMYHDRIPGWGNSFFKDRPDPDWAAVAETISQWKISRTIQGVTLWLHHHDRKIYPNAGCFTAATALILGIPVKLSPYLLIRGRLDVWAKMAADQP